MDANKREIRTIACELAVREAPQDAQVESRTITGRAIVFNAESEILDDWGMRFREIIRPEAVIMEFLNSQDVKMNMLHDRNLTLARCNKGKGSMRMAVDEQGVTFEFEAPKCDIGDRCLEMVKRGDYSGCSFEFYPEEYDVEEREGGKDVTIIHKKLRMLTALTIGMDPAYSQTSVNARELWEKTPAGIASAKAEEEEREREEKEKELAMMREMNRRVELQRRLYDENY